MKETDMKIETLKKAEEFIDSLGSAKLADCFKMEKPQATSRKRLKKDTIKK